MITKTIKILGLCMLILCSASIQAGLGDKIRGLKTSIINAEKNHPHYFYSAITATGGLAFYFSEALTAQIYDRLPANEASRIGRFFLEKMSDQSHFHLFYKMEKGIIAAGGAAFTIGALKLLKAFMK